MARKYYTLAERGQDGRWSPQFGDYDRDVVEQERRDRIDGGFKAKALRIVSSSDQQEHIDYAFNLLNAAK